jgi:hypothetical protein
MLKVRSRTQLVRGGDACLTAHISEAPKMFYTLRFENRFWLWELRINNFRARFYRTRYEAEKLIARYRRMVGA